ncbi:cellulose binding domain-containing protein [Phaeacidiphilus oryzae]|uniref:cellulose binding domain-containing protein n=1 Tax=Phaeacidiphilus oryzae TaxID=348818 RepID=UPI00055DA029|nr:cellulose binding domain-containing protein [Phaeacidiphilus oryzae]
MARSPSPGRRWAATATALALTLAAAGTAAVLSAAPAPADTGEGSASATLSGSLDPLGVNTAAWDGGFTDAAIAPALSAAHTGLVRYPGGSWADQYLWQSNSVSGQTQSVDFGAYAKQVDAVGGGQKLVTVDYGSDTPASAAAWVKQSQTSGEGVALWEVGNEEYGSWEVDDHANPHTASSYATNALSYMQAMKAADPHAQICYDYAMDGDLAPGAGVSGWQDWNDTILQADAADIDCADVHWYPINGTPTESVQSIMQLVDRVPAAAAEVHTALSTYDPKAEFVVGETNMSNAANAWNEEPVGALFSAANAMEWLANGAQSIDWWDVHNYGSPTADFGMFSSGGNGEPSGDTPYPPYYGYLLASKLAVHGATVGTLPLGTADLYSYYSQLPDGSYAVMLVNAGSAATSVGTADLGITSASETSSSYSAADPGGITSGTASGSTISVPAQSVVVLSGATGAPPTSAPPTTAPPTTAPPTTPPGGSGCKASYAVSSDWGSGFTANVTVANTGSADTKSWKVSWSWPGNQAVLNMWNAVYSQSATSVTAASQSYNADIPPGGSTSFGLQATYSGGNTAPTLSCTPG